MPTFSYHDHQIHYEHYGLGNRLLLTLHGIGGKGRLFANISRPMWEDYTVLSLDLPYHGETQWQDMEYTPHQLADVLQQLATQQGKTTFDLMLHSMGGRLLMGLIPLLVRRLGRVYLFAPGGFQYVFTESRPWWGRSVRAVVRRLFENNEGFVWVLDGAYRLKLLNEQAHRLFVDQIRTPERRARLLRSWVTLAHFPMRIRRYERQLLLDHQIPLHFFVGDRDTITPAKHVRRFLQQYPYGTFTVVHSDHYLVREDAVAPFAEWYAEHRSKFNL